ncbi:MAG: hypothetical protein US58_C0021G0006 [Candidatus Magasanikbacteria bacterium GW2011_GWA2_37_8]|uniref:Uncharacterized protein n=1 Tax=Candidatus Magasanikbacteria bacterium GW2011_GWA2_37_8 TaxID=1619036 RepID=A0A0G0JTU4_9BACT|nr:MAG: hypothetical protein US58_C0021G0006 [Candidatus Magasanikbacteria bacterium GW2011_GWA2_37_8]
MLKKIVYFFLFVSLLIVPLSLVLAAGGNYGADEAMQATGGALKSTVAGVSSPIELIGKVIAIGLSFLGIIFFGLIFYAGFTWMIAMGNSEKISKAKDILEAAAVGLVLVLAAYGIAKFIFTSLGV